MDRSISTINADVAHAELGARGQGIVWAIVDTGVDGAAAHFSTHGNLVLPDGLSHWDFSSSGAAGSFDGEGAELPAGRRLKLATDPDGHGTSVAALIAGESFDSGGRLLRGMAPECKILSINIFHDDQYTELEVIAALRAIRALNTRANGALRVHGVLIPLELPWNTAFACGYSPVCVEVDRLVNAGVVVVASAGNRGFDPALRRSVEATIADPGNAPHAITVGSTHRTLPREYGPSYFSARGPTADGRPKPDLLAPGERITTCLAGKDLRESGSATGMRSGASFAAAHVSGAVAALLSVNRELIGRPLEVKSLLMETAVDLNRERNYQGAGLVDVVAALRRARGAPVRGAEARRRQPVKVVCSYAQDDAPLWLEFKSHLAPMTRSGLIDLWSEEALLSGADRDTQFAEHLDGAEIVLLFITSHFFASDDCDSHLKRALQRSKAANARVIPVLASPMDFDATSLAGTATLPAGRRFVSTAFKDPHEGCATVTAELRKIIMDLRSA